MPCHAIPGAGAAGAPQVCLEFIADLPETDLELQRWLGEPGGQIHC